MGHLGSIALLLVLGMAVPARGAVLYSPPLSWSIIAGDLAFQCEIVNVSSSPREVRIRLINDAAATTADSGTVLLAPDATFTLDNPVFGGDRTYCRFDVEGGRKRFRASACTFSIADDACVAAVNAE